ncbi:MAG: hypothetical protein JJU37_09745 [Balneolaceae bacterium]|nr:hypothetical protein [Balneolaceae bacterium]
MKFLLLSPLKITSFFIGALLLFAACGTNQPEPEPGDLTIEYLITLSDEELMERDSDGDGLSDYDEIYIYGTDPLNPDTDGDGLSDYDEIFLFGTDPLIKDTSGNGFTDGQEVEMGTNPLDPNDPPFIRSNELNPVYFHFGDSELDNSASEVLEINSQKLITAEKFRVEIIVFKNESEVDENGLESVFDQRAEAVSDYLIQNGVTEERIDVNFESISTSECPDGAIDEFNSCSEIRRVSFRPINPYPFYPEY